MANRRWCVYFTKEYKYNYYRDVDLDKKRPLFVWKNNLNNIKHYWLCFYCSTQVDKYNKDYCVFIKKDKNKGFSKDTYIWLHKPIIFWKYDFISFRDHNNQNSRPQCEIINKEDKERIRSKISFLYDWIKK